MNAWNFSMERPVKSLYVMITAEIMVLQWISLSTDIK